MSSALVPVRRVSFPPLLMLAVDSAAFVLAAVGFVHLLLVVAFDFNLLSEAFRAGPVAVASLETVLALAAVYAAAVALNRNV